jgi:hypothetical protein
MINCKPLVINGNTVSGYYVDPNGGIITTKQGSPRYRSPNISGKSPYPKLELTYPDGSKKSHGVHRIVCETYIPFPVPAGVTNKEWEKTPASVKAVVMRGYYVNHIDHDKTNYHPSNLEWATSKENADKYHEYKVHFTESTFRPLDSFIG